MTKYLIIDCETSGLFDFSKPADAPGQPRLCGFTMIPVSTDDGLEVTDGYTALIKPDGWTIAPEITAINGLTTEKCEAEGVPVTEVLQAYTSMVLGQDGGHAVVAYNAQFDTKVMRGELRLAGMDDLFLLTPNICAMRACGALGIEKAGAKRGGFPKLSDAYRHFYGTEPAEQHTSLADATSCLMIFRKLLEIGAVPEPAVHYAKRRPEGTAA